MTAPLESNPKRTIFEEKKLDTNLTFKSHTQKRIISDDVPLKQILNAEIGKSSEHFVN